MFGLKGPAPMDSLERVCEVKIAFRLLISESVSLQCNTESIRGTLSKRDVSCMHPKQCRDA